MRCTVSYHANPRATSIEFTCFLRYIFFSGTHVRTRTTGDKIYYPPTHRIIFLAGCQFINTSMSTRMYDTMAIPVSPRIIVRIVSYNTIICISDPFAPSAWFGPLLGVSTRRPAVLPVSTLSLGGVLNDFIFICFSWRHELRPSAVIYVDYACTTLGCLCLSLGYSSAPE